RVGLELGWAGSAQDQAAAGEALAALEAGVKETAAADDKPVTLSLVDRFDTVLDAGRRIASALSREATFAAAREAAVRLLRGERCLVLKVEPSTAGTDVTTASGESDGGYSQTMVNRALAAGRSIAFLEGAPDHPSESVLLSGVRSALC